MNGDTIACMEVSRLSRSTKQLCEIMEFVEKNKIKLIVGTFIRAYEKDYRGKRWGALSPEDRKYLLSDYSLTDIDAWVNGEYKEFTGNGSCFIDLNAECCCIPGIVDDEEIFINDDSEIFIAGWLED